MNVKVTQKVEIDGNITETTTEFVVDDQKLRSIGEAIKAFIPALEQALIGAKGLIQINQSVTKSDDPE